MLSAEECIPNRKYFSALGRAVWDETSRKRVKYSFSHNFSALGRAVWDGTSAAARGPVSEPQISVLSVEPYGMKPHFDAIWREMTEDFSALGRAVWDETAHRKRPQHH